MSAPALAQRTYGYDAAPADRALHRARPGLEVIEAMRDGTVAGSPMWRTAGCRIAEAEVGRVVFEAEVGPWALNFGGTAHGGWTATLLDSAMGFAVMSALPAGRIHTTAELSIRYVRALPPGPATVRAIGTVVHAGRRTATAEGRLVDAQGRTCAHGATTCLVLPVD